MNSDPRKNALRLRKSHEPDPEPPPDSAIGQRLWDAQSVRKAVFASLIAILVFTVLWNMVSTLSSRFFPWVTLLLGVLIGFTVRRAGLGLSWPFPVVAGVMTIIGAIASSLCVTAAMVAQELDTRVFTVLGGSLSSWGSFADQVLTPADFVFAAAAAGIAAFFSMRRLSRRQYLALRLWSQSKTAD